MRYTARWFSEKSEAFLQHVYAKYIELRLRRTVGLHIGHHVRILGRPIIGLSNGGEIWIENQVTLNSSNLGYHVNMHSPVKLFADRPGATIQIGELSRINGTCIHAWKEVRIGKRCLVAANCHIMDSNGHDLSFDNVENRIHT
jgi:acetyltransferase-like isoleucine patch superfamily enzyme